MLLDKSGLRKKDKGSTKNKKIGDGKVIPSPSQNEIDEALSRIRNSYNGDNAN